MQDDVWCNGWCLVCSCSPMGTLVKGMISISSPKLLHNKENGS